MPIVSNKRPYTHWMNKFHEVKKIADEPALNKEGFWKKREHKEPKIERADKT